MGNSLPTIDNLYALSELFQMPVDEMICGNRTPVIKRSIKTQPIGTDVFILIFEKITEKENRIELYYSSMTMNRSSLKMVLETILREVFL